MTQDLRKEMERLARRVAERLRSITVKDTAPVRTGELRNSIHVSKHGGGCLVGTNKIYARAVHEGAPAMVIRPKNRKALWWKGAAHPVKQVSLPRRRGNPYFKRALDQFLKDQDKEMKRLKADADLAKLMAWQLKKAGVKNVKVQ